MSLAIKRINRFSCELIERGTDSLHDYTRICRCFAEGKDEEAREVPVNIFYWPKHLSSSNILLRSVKHFCYQSFKKSDSIRSRQSLI
jgi:hypothetical protein